MFRKLFLALLIASPLGACAVHGSGQGTEGVDYVVCRENVSTPFGSPTAVTVSGTVCPAGRHVETAGAAHPLN